MIWLKKEDTFISPKIFVEGAKEMQCIRSNRETLSSPQIPKGVNILHLLQRGGFAPDGDKI